VKLDPPGLVCVFLILYALQLPKQLVRLPLLLVKLALGQLAHGAVADLPR
jgi:hypothetical protein